MIVPCCTPLKLSRQDRSASETAQLPTHLVTANAPSPNTSPSSYPATLGAAIDNAATGPIGQRKYLRRPEDLKGLKPFYHGTAINFRARIVQSIRQKYSFRLATLCPSPTRCHVFEGPWSGLHLWKKLKSILTPSADTPRFNSAGIFERLPY